MCKIICISTLEGNCLGQTIETEELGKTDRHTHTQTDRQTLPNLLSTCFAKAMQSMKKFSVNNYEATFDISVFFKHCEYDVWVYIVTYLGSGCSCLDNPVLCHI